jgi:hypothetical protein
MLIKLKADENDLVIIQTYFWKQSWRSRGSLWITIRSTGEGEEKLQLNNLRWLECHSW